MDMKTLISEVGSWPIEDRLELIGEVWDSIVATSGIAKLTDAQKQDLERRLDAYRDTPKTGSTWDDVRARLEKGCQ